MKSETAPETIQRVLGAYELGPKLRRLRLRKKIALVDLGKHTGLSPSMLSQLENGKLIPTLPTLARIAMFDVGMEHFFSDKREEKMFSIVRAAERMTFPESAGIPIPAYFFECLAFPTQGKGMHAYVAEFPRLSAKQVTTHTHDGSEFIFVLEGRLTIRFQGTDHELRERDSLHLDSSEPHSYRGTGKTGARAVVITTPLRL